VARVTLGQLLATELSISTRDVKSSRPSWPRDQNFGLGLGLGLEALASVHYRQKINSYCARENDDIKVCDFDHNYKNSAYVVTHHLILFIYLILSFALALASTSRNWPRPYSPGVGLGLGLKILASFNISDLDFYRFDHSAKL